MRIGKLSLGIASLVLVTGAAVAHAQFKLPGKLGGLMGGSSAPQGAESVSNDTLVQSFVASNSEILTAQKFLSLAYGEKDKAALLDSEAQAIQSPGVGADELKKAVELSNKTNDELAAKQAKKEQLSAEERQYYVQSLPHFVKGIAGTRQLLAQVRNIASNPRGALADGGVNMIGSGASKMKAAMFVVKATPSYSKSVFDTFRKTVSIGKSNNVKMPADATSALTGLAP